MSNKIKITKLLIETKAGKEIPLELDEAEELYKQLHMLFKDKDPSISLTPICQGPHRWYPLYYTTAGTDNTVVTDEFSIKGDTGLNVTYSTL